VPGQGAAHSAAWRSTSLCDGVMCDFNPTRIDEVIDFMVARVLDQLRVEHQLAPRWGEDQG
jgi:hypothetical protein